MLVEKVLKVVTYLYPNLPWVVMPQGGRGRPGCYCSDVRQVVVGVVRSPTQLAVDCNAAKR